MKQFAYTILIFAIGIYCCRNKFETELSIEGLWCDEYYQCIYFNKNMCLIDNTELNNYTASNSKIDITTLAGGSRSYQFIKANDSLKIRKNEELSYRNYIKVNTLEAITFDKLYYSQISDSNEFAFSINEDGNFHLEIIYHESIKKGRYCGQLDVDLLNLISAFINQMDWKISNKLDTKITSDMQEWGLIIHTKSGEEFKLYHNYVGINSNHKYFATIINFFPHLLTLKSTNFNDDLLKAATFRKSEFERNLREIDL